MKYWHQIVVFLAIATIALTAVAEEVYKSVDKKGVVEFSDTPSAGAKAVDVNPNVVDLAPANPSRPSPKAEKSAVKVQPEVISEDVTGGYSSDYRNRREMHREREKRIEHREKAIELPQRREATRAPAQGGAGRR